MITKKQIEDLRDQMIKSAIDLAHEYGVTPTLKGATQKPQRTVRVAEDFAAQIGLADDVHMLALQRGMMAFDRMAALSEHVDEDDPIQMAAHIPTMAAYVGGVWMEGLMLGIEVGRKYPAEKKT